MRRPKSKEEILKNLERVRRNVCAYASPNFCDCKYGIGKGHDEKTGCPELRDAMYYIQSIPEDDKKVKLEKKIVDTAVKFVGNSCFIEFISLLTKLAEMVNKLKEGEK